MDNKIQDLTRVLALGMILDIIQDKIHDMMYDTTQDRILDMIQDKIQGTLMPLMLETDITKSKVRHKYTLIFLTGQILYRSKT